MDENCKHVIGIDANVSPSADPADGESSAMLVRHLFQQLSLMSEKMDQLNNKIDQQSREINFLRSELQQQRDRQEATQAVTPYNTSCPNSTSCLLKNSPALLMWKQSY